VKIPWKASVPASRAHRSTIHTDRYHGPNPGLSLTRGGWGQPPSRAIGAGDDGAILWARVTQKLQKSKLRLWRKGNVGNQRDAATGGLTHAGHNGRDCCGTCATPRSHDTSRIAWAKLMARVGEAFPLERPACGGDIRLRGDGRRGSIVHRTKFAQVPTGFSEAEGG